MNSIKDQLKKYYNDNVNERDANIKQPWKLKLRNNILLSMKENSNMSVLEIGAGTGQDSLFFMQNGMDVIAVDLSENHVKRCREKGINAHVMDFSNMTFDDGTFDCIYGMNCLLHVPNDDLIKVLLELKRVTKQNGHMYLCQYGNNDKTEEGVMANEDKGSRFFSFRTYESFENSVNEVALSILESDKIDIGEEEYYMQYFILNNK